MRLQNVGPATAGDLLLLGVRSLADLRRRDAFELYETLCHKTGERHDPCVIDVFLALVHHADGAPQRSWWHYTPLRKRLLAPSTTTEPAAKAKPARRRRSR
jgi:hypothetical protein